MTKIFSILLFLMYFSAGSVLASREVHNECNIFIKEIIDSLNIDDQIKNNLQKNIRLNLNIAQSFYSDDSNYYCVVAENFANAISESIIKNRLYSRSFFMIVQDFILNDKNIVDLVKSYAFQLDFLEEFKDIMSFSVKANIKNYNLEYFKKNDLVSIFLATDKTSIEVIKARLVTKTSMDKLYAVYLDKILSTAMIKRDYLKSLQILYEKKRKKIFEIKNYIDIYECFMFLNKNEQAYKLKPILISLLNAHNFTDSILRLASIAESAKDNEEYLFWASLLSTKLKNSISYEDFNKSVD